MAKYDEKLKRSVVQEYLEGGASTNGSTSSFNDLLAIWDAYNGTGTAQLASGIPSGWRAYDYWSATPSATGHASVYLLTGLVSNGNDILNFYVALQVL